MVRFGCLMLSLVTVFSAASMCRSEVVISAEGQSFGR